MYGENPFSLYWPALAEAMAEKVKENKKKEPAEKAGRGNGVIQAEFFPGGKAAGPYPPPRLAQAYVIWQSYGAVFSPAEALGKGTIFPELYSPYPY